MQDKISQITEKYSSKQFPKVNQLDSLTNSELQSADRFSMKNERYQQIWSDKPNNSNFVAEFGEGTGSFATKNHYSINDNFAFQDS
jgi:hypothetical protein